MGINVTMVDWDQLVLDVFVTTRGQKARMQEEEEPQEREANRTRGQRTKWEKEKFVHQDVIREL